MERPLISCRIFMQNGPFDLNRYTAVQHATVTWYKQQRLMWNTGVSQTRAGLGWVASKASALAYGVCQHAATGCCGSRALLRFRPPASGLCSSFSKCSMAMDAGPGKPLTALSTSDVGLKKLYFALSAAWPWTQTPPEPSQRSVPKCRLKGFCSQQSPIP